MTDIAIITTSYWRDFDACRLLCESIDRHVSGYRMHHIVVATEDVARFSVLAGPRRQVVDADSILPLRLLEVPMRWKGRRYWWSPRLTGPVYGWHLQQLRKIAMTLAQPCARVLHVDSDNWFCRRFDAAALAGAERVPLHVERGVVDAAMPEHRTWLDNAHRLLGLPSPPAAGDDYIGQMIVWEKASLRAMTERIEAVTHRPWAEAVLRMRQFSEYMLYGAMVAGTPELMARHEPVSDSPCHVYWNGPALDRAGFADFIRGMRPEQSAIAVQSFTLPPLDLVREFVLDGGAAA